VSSNGAYVTVTEWGTPHILNGADAPPYNVLACASWVRFLRINGGAVRDILDVSNVTAGAFDNLENSAVVGNGGDDEITGTDITDTGYSETLYGNDGDDHILGGDGDDDIYGGLGSDNLVGGAADDIYYFTQLPPIPIKDTDTITDSSGTYDRLDFSSLGNGISINIGVTST
jgi:Ca2+-binding RTX toxin-like protein